MNIPSVHLVIRYFYSPFEVSGLVCGAHLRLLTPRARRLFSQWMLHWWRVNDSAAREPCVAPPLMPNTRLNKSQVPFPKFSQRPDLWTNPA